MKKLLIWGTGKAAEGFLKQVVNGEVIGFIDSNPKSSEFNGKPIYLPERITHLDYDVLIIASTYIAEIKQMCSELKVDENRTIYIKLEKQYEKMLIKKDNGNLLQGVVNDLYYQSIRKQMLILPHYRMNCDMIESSLLDKAFEEEHNQEYYLDYTRYRTFELIADVILKDNIQGNVAEVGVFKGDFARIINEKFPDRKLYLFDTFEGFDPEEAKNEIKSGNCDEKFVVDFNAGMPDVNYVIKKMPYPNHCIIKKGFFPETAKDLEDRFAFVSIDVDFEESIYNSMEYFYPRLNRGGFIFVHDYNNSFLFGVKRAIKRYEEKYGRVSKIPLSDNGGTLIITK